MTNIMITRKNREACIAKMFFSMIIALILIVVAAIFHNNNTVWAWSLAAGMTFGLLGAFRWAQLIWFNHKLKEMEERG